MISNYIRQNHWNEQEWLYIQGLSLAIEAICKKYIYEKEGLYHSERIFAYELYYRWKKVLTKKMQNPEMLLLNGELAKHYYHRKEYGFPDMVLHGDYANKDKQYIICEIKSSRNPISKSRLEKDVTSLVKGIGELDYKCGVFIHLGDKSMNMIKRLRKILHDSHENEREKWEKRIIFIGVVDNKNIHYPLVELNLPSIYA